MDDQTAAQISFMYRRKPASWIFEAEPSMFPIPILVPESEAAAINYDLPGNDRPSSLFGSHGLAAFHLYKKNCGTEESPLFNAHPGIERHRALLVGGVLKLRNLAEHGGVIWEGQREDDPNRFRVFVVPESMIAWSIEELWRYPFKPHWRQEVAYAVLADALFEVA